MGWWGHGKYDGDGTSSVQTYMVEEVAKKFQLELTDKKDKPIDLDDMYLSNVSKGFLSQESAQKVISHLDYIESKVLSKVKKSKKGHFLFDEDNACEYMMLADFIMNHKIQMPKRIQEKSLAALEFLNDEHALDFNSPSARIRVLNKFIKQLEEYQLVVQDNKLQSDEVQKSQKMKM